MENFDKTIKESVGVITDLIYHVRGRDVMLDADLARIYGYTTKALNRQVLRNMEKFEGEEFMFRLTRDELEEISVRCHFGTSRNGGSDLVRCKNCTSRNRDDIPVRSQNVTSPNYMFSGQDGGTRYLPYAFTEQGIYMLMTVLRGELAVKQSRALVMAFKSMKDYIIKNRNLLDQREQLKTMMLVAESDQHIGKIEKEIVMIDNRLVKMEEKMEEVVMRNEISPIMLDFNKTLEQNEYLFMNGELMEAKEVYQDIYRKAKKNIIIIDDYVDIKTLRLLSVAGNVEVTIFSDNVRNYLHKNDLIDFEKEFPNVKIKILKTGGVIHDRFVVIDYGLKNEELYHCGASSKDAGKKITVITKMEGTLVRESMAMVIEALVRNPEVELR